MEGTDYKGMNGSPLLKEFDLHYYDENGEEIPNE